MHRQHASPLFRVPFFSLLVSLVAAGQISGGSLNTHRASCNYHFLLTLLLQAAVAAGKLNAGVRIGMSTLCVASQMHPKTLGLAY